MISRLTDISPVVCSPSTTLKEVLARIEMATPHLFQIVIDEGGRVLGTLTDGDLRRAILDGATMATPAQSCMRQQPILGRLGETNANSLLVARNWFLPIVDDGGRIDHVLVTGRQSLPMQRALVMAGGFGKRLGELTKNKPKPLLPVAGQPVLDRVLSQLEDIGIANIDISVHFLAEQVQAFVAERQNQASISLIEERDPMGTAGALSLIAKDLDGPVLVVNGDVLSQIDYSAMHRFHTTHGYDGTIAVKSFETEIPYGVVKQGPEGQFAGIDEKPMLSHFVAAGIYYLSPEFAALTPRGRPVDMPEVITNGWKAGLRIGLFPVHEYWKDVGRPSDLEAANSDHDA